MSVADTVNVAVILVAAGAGTRLDAGLPKAFAPLCGQPLLVHALRGVLGCNEVGHVVVVAPGSHADQARDVIDQARDVIDQARDLADQARDAAGQVRDLAAQDPRVEVVAGGADRSASVAAGLAALRPDDGIVLVHDAARCLAPADLFARVIHAVRAGHPAVVPGLGVSDTIKVVDPQGRVLATPARESLRGIQTPQGFSREVLVGAHNGGGSATDDAGLVERAGGRVHVIDGDPLAFKITTAVDLAVASAMLQDVPYAG